MSIFDFYNTKYVKENWYWTRNPGRLQGDFIYNNCAKIVYDKDTSDWARIIVKRCTMLTYDHKRWPDEYNDELVCHTWITWIVNKAINKLFAANLPYKFQERMVRDIYIAVYTANLLHGYPIIVEDLRPVWYVWTPAFHCWRKYLITKKPIYRKLYYLFSRPSKRDWVQRLEWLQETSIQFVER